MRKSKQLIRGVQVETTPIVSRSSSAIEGQLILCLFSRGDEDIKKLWPDLKRAHGDDVLKDAANTMFQTALSTGMIGLPMPHHDHTCEEMIGSVDEKVWASKLLGSSARELG